MAKKHLGEFFHLKKFLKIGKQIIKILETIKSNKKLMPII
jgi:hypothetical protein